MAPATPKPRTLRAATADSLAVDAATVEALEALGGASIRPLLLKGPALATLLYEAGEERLWDDADLLVDPSLLDRAIEALAEIGFHPRFSDPVARGAVPHAVPLVRRAGERGGSASIDLHLSFAGVGVEPAAFWDSVSAQPDAIELFGRPIPVPSVPARLALVALHAASHGRPAQRSMGDLRRAVTRFDGDDWSAAAALAESWDALDYFVVGLGLDPAGEGLLASLGIDHEPGTAAVMRGDGMPRAQRSFEQLGRAGGSARARIVLGKIFPSREAMRSWQPLARRGRAGLALAYAWRPFWLLWQLGPAARSWLKARRR